MPHLKHANFSSLILGARISSAFIVGSKKTNRLVIVEESWPFGSVSSEISYNVQRNAFDFLDASIVRICSADVPMAYAPNLVEEFLPSSEDIVEKVKEVLYL